MTELRQLEKGPFYLGKIKDSEIHIYSHDFSHDVMMSINGDFKTEEAAIEYVRAVVDVLNSALDKPATGEEK